MARRSTKAEATEAVSKTKGMTPEMLAAHLRDKAAKTFGEDSIVTSDVFMDSVYGIPLKGNLPLQYLLGVDVLALGRCMSLVGIDRCR